MPETMVRMGELAVSAEAGHMLMSLGLGSCIGLALIDRRGGIAGLAHIVLPTSTGHVPGPAAHKFADHAVPALIDELAAVGAPRVRLQAMLVGGASMFGAPRRARSTSARATRSPCASARGAADPGRRGGRRRLARAHDQGRCDDRCTSLFAKPGARTRDFCRIQRAWR